VSLTGVDTIVKSDDDIAMRYYPGGKGKSFQHIINLLPPHGTYIETHLGGGAVLRQKRPADTSIGIDLDERVIQWWRYSHPAMATFICADAVEFLRSYSFSGNELIYCDPPYLPQTRRRLRVYKYDYSEADHVRLLAVLRSVPCSVVVSAYPSLLYESELRDWNCVYFQAKTHNGVREEKLWFNFPIPDKLHDSRYLGGNFRERQNIKRRMDRLQGKLARLTRVEQHEVVSWLSKRLKDPGDSNATLHLLPRQ